MEKVEMLTRKEMIKGFKRAVPHKNMFTPVWLNYYVGVNLVIELTRSYSGDMFGVTVVKYDSTYKTFELYTELSKPFFNRDEADFYIRSILEEEKTACDESE